MRIAFISQANVNIYPGMYQLAVSLARHGAEVQIVAPDRPVDPGVLEPAVSWIEAAPILHGPLARVPGLRLNIQGMYRSLVRFRPDWIVAEQEFLVPALLYGLSRRSVRLAGYFPDYLPDSRALAVVRQLARRLDVCIDICDLRLRWRQEAWPKMRAKPFVIRQAPFRTGQRPAPRAGPARLVHTGSANLVRMMNLDRLSRFLTRLCQHGVAVDWYVSGSRSTQPDDETLEALQRLVDHFLYNVRRPVPKAELPGVLGQYDAGLLWAPPIDAKDDRTAFATGASNKIGEYIAAGLIVAHAGNPGLAYLPADVAAVFDPTDPEAGADQLAAALADRAEIERRRQAVHRYHLDEMNFESQSAALVGHLLAS